MSKYSRSSLRVEDPFCYLALNVFNQAFRDIKAYFSHDGTPEELEEGKKSIRWITKMEGNFKIYAGASDVPIEKFHQWCLWKINEIKKEVCLERRGVSEKDRQNEAH